MEQYLKQYCDEEITNLLNNADDLVHVSVNVSLAHLQRKQPTLYEAILQCSRDEQPRWDACLLNAQKSLVEGNMFLDPGFQIKQNCHVRFVNMPQTAAEAVKRTPFPSNDNVGQFMQIKGSVIRMTQARFLEFKREYVCSRCKMEFRIEAEYEKNYVFDPPRSCPLATQTGCKGIPHQKSAQPQADYCRDFQEIRIQELMSERNVPASLVVTLENDLVDSCQPGDCVSVVGRIERRWGPLQPGKITEVTVAMSANSVSKDENKMNLGKDLPEHLVFVRAEWQNTIKEIGELGARDLLVQSICPGIHGMYPVKLAIAISLASCTERMLGCGANVRNHSHLLLVGDPGLAKSRLLKSAVEISARSIFTTGMGCSAAGLTAAAVKEDGEWQLEAGALVLADGGVCCIDEFNLMREQDKTSIHEAMEQQTVSMAKAGLVCKLSTRCVVLAATNPRNLFSLTEMVENESANLGVGGPLLSRFDLVLTLGDTRDCEWDIHVANHILTQSMEEEAQEAFEEVPSGGYWTLERLKTHFLAIKDINPKVSDDANAILASYYKLCRSDAARDPSRTTVRLLDSLVRLSQAHARLVFREEVTALDAITVIRLMESSWGFGKVIQPMDLIRSMPPLEPSRKEIAHLLQQLRMDRITDGIEVSRVDSGKMEQYRRELAKKPQETNFGNKWDEILTQQKTTPDGELEGSETTLKRKHLEAGELYSKYSFTQRQKNHVKKMKKDIPKDLQNMNDINMNDRENAKPNATTSDPIQNAREDINNQQLDCILSSLRKNFVSELYKATQPSSSSNVLTESALGSGKLDTRFPSAFRRSQVAREQSFRLMLDVSCLVEDLDDDAGLNEQINSTSTRKNQHFSETERENHLTPPTLENAEKGENNDFSKFSFKRKVAKDVSESSKATTTNAITEKKEESRYRFESRRKTETSQNKSTSNTVKTSDGTRNPINPSLSDDDSFDSTFGTEDNIFSRSEKCAPAATVSGDQPVSEQTRNKLQRFQYVPKDVGATVAEECVGKEQDDSAYESQRQGFSSTLGECPDLDAELEYLDNMNF
ncbi:DNA helicase MCM9-like [Toxorhynchites rutilus septentrionalis]|uniref:DNA helicase MCM9-like n=1 Tax=Toxorhynchites rutilus septentrionalis TaxID=329112 RepID=UPI00247A1A81|nr:DNA helicase MCM9-like [Toxorhynchites rutilus septentrionalis]XP_055635309.1 DNA helicase MCM9-like [Toxorhynchites rutilus septentrionalis]XP_055635310.1 DNA helicase MCM9-like [Toxorhynchites rutilus septentrionalis]